MTSSNKDKSRVRTFLESRKVAGYTWRQMMIKLGIFFILIIFIPLLFPSGRSLKYTDLVVGSIVNKKVIAPFTFPVLKTDEQLAEDRKQTAAKIPLYYRFQDELADETNRQLTAFDNYLDSLLQKYTYEDLLAAVNNPEKDSLTSSFSDSLIFDMYNRFRIKFAQTDLENLFTAFRNNLFTSLKSLLTGYYQKNLIEEKLKDIQDKKIILIRSGVEEDLDLTQTIDLQTARKTIMRQLENAEYRNILTKLLSAYLKTNTKYDDVLTAQRKQEAINDVSLASDLVYENERIIDANERVTEQIYQKLRSLEYAYSERSTLQGDLQNFLYRFGKYLLTALILFIFFIFLLKNRPKVFASNKKLLLINLIIFLQIGLGALIVGPLNWPAYVIPTTISSMLLAILFDSGVGLLGTALVGFMMGGILGLDYSVTTMTFVTGTVAIYAVAQIRTRNQIFKAIFYIFMAYVLILIAFHTLRFEEISVTLEVIIYCLPNAILSPFITYFALGVFERAFDITTDVTLLELSDLNHPLLKLLANKAPGTFHHSIIVGNLAEAAAKRIDGANSLLARVGSYYHDIGKMNKSEYFVENQKGGDNKHVSLAPNMSALILAAHVKYGLELGMEYKLPKKIRDFIPEHHGTTVMSYFYNKALETKDAQEINIEDYRYPGPKPQSKETAIVMLADTVEAAAKTLKNPTISRLRKLVNDLLEKRFLEGELEDCDLTMRDLRDITEGFVSVLVGIYHERIEYPEEEKTKKKYS